MAPTSLFRRAFVLSSHRARVPFAVLLFAAGAAQAVDLARVDKLLHHWQTQAARQEVQRSLDRNNADHLTALGRVLAQEASYGPAITELERATQLAANDPEPWLHLGETRLAARQEAAANQAFEKARQLASEQVKGSRSFENLYLLGVAQQRTKRYGEAVQTLAQARDQRSNDALVHFQIGATHAFQQKWPDAIAALDRALQLDPALAYAYYYRGLSHSRTGRKDLLVNDLGRFLELAPKAPEAEQARRLLRSAR